MATLSADGLCRLAGGAAGMAVHRQQRPVRKVTSVSSALPNIRPPEMNVFALVG